MKKAVPGFKEQFSKLISIPSVSCVNPNFDMSNHAFIEVLASWLEDLGFSVEIMEVDEDSGKYNLIAVAGRGDGGLVLAGHTDTVPFDEKSWDTDPFVLTELDNRFYGLGTSDMKGFFPIVMDVIRDIDLEKLTSPLYILATCDEESNMSGAKALVDRNRSMGRHALVGEPTGLRPVNAHKGIFFETIKLTGQSGHSSDPALGKNALEGMNRVINGLSNWRDELKHSATNAQFKIPYPTMNFGSIRGGDSPNRICGDCELKIDVRFLPGMELEELRACMRQRVLSSIDGLGLAVEFDRVFPGIPGMETDRSSDIVITAEKLAGVDAGSVAFGTEGPYLSQLGMDTIVLGPGDIDVAHQANEYLGLNGFSP